MTMGDRIVVMKDGLIQQIDTPQNLYEHPRNIFVASFIGSPQMNFIDCTLRLSDGKYFVEIGHDRLNIAPQKINEKMRGFVDRSVKAGIRPEDIYDDADFLARHPDSVLEAALEVKEMMGSEAYLYLNYGENHLTARVSPDTVSEMGAVIKAGVDARKMRLFDPETEEAIMN
jgi:multiple sugar transport system ATP-binding protein